MSEKIHMTVKRSHFNSRFKKNNDIKENEEFSEQEDKILLRAGRISKRFCLRRADLRNCDLVENCDFFAIKTRNYFTEEKIVEKKSTLKSWDKVEDEIYVTFEDVIKWLFSIGICVGQISMKVRGREVFILDGKQFMFKEQLVLYANKKRIEYGERLFYVASVMMD